MSELFSIVYLVEHHPTINQQRLTGHVVGIRPGEVRDAGGHVFRFGQTAKRDAFGKGFRPVAKRFTRRLGDLTVDFRPHRRFDDPRAVGVNGDPQRREIPRGGLG